MKKTLLAVVVTVLLGASGWAQSTSSQTDCKPDGRGGYDCTTIDTTPPPLLDTFGGMRDSMRRAGEAARKREAELTPEQREQREYQRLEKAQERADRKAQKELEKAVRKAIKEAKKAERKSGK
jgi:hypothetical protein